jgi:hypothetical protein
MKRFTTFALLLGLAGILGCEPPKPAPKEAPKAETGAEATPPAEGTPPAETPKEDMPKEETK